MYLTVLNSLTLNKKLHSYKKLKISKHKIFIIQFLSLIVFLVVLILNDFKVPIFSEGEIVDFAKEFFLIPGSSSVFMLSTIGSIIHHIRLKNYSKYTKLLVYFIDSLIVFSMFLSGKRMGIVLLGLSWLFILITNNHKHNFKKYIKSIFPIILIIFISSFLRLSQSYENFFMENSVLNIQSLEQFLLIQPLLYIIPNFHNLNMVLENFINLVPFTDSNFYEVIISQPWNMTTFFGDLRSYSFFINFLIIIFILLIIRRSYKNINFSEKNFLIISYLIPKLFFLFAGNLFDFMTFYFLIIILIIPTKKFFFKNT